MGGKAVASIIEELKRRPSRNWSIVITLYGDAIVPRGGSIWLGTLLDFFRLIDIGEGAVRTAMSRLAADGWLERTRQGRNSFYRLTARGETTFVSATAQIYSPRGPQWDGGFDVLFVDRNGENGRDTSRAFLEQTGFGVAAPGVLLSPHGLDGPAPPDTEAIALRLSGDADACRRLAAASWPIAEAGHAYGRFLVAFQPLDRAIAGGGKVSDAQAMVARTLLVHEYRRIVLRYCPLPLELLPSGWPGEDARQLCRRLYHALLDQSESWLDRYGRCQAGPLPQPDPAIHRRFGA